MKKPGNYEYMAVVREIEKLNEIKDPIKLKQQQDIVEGFKLEYGTELFEQMVKDAKQKTLDYKKSLLENSIKDLVIKR